MCKAITRETRRGSLYDEIGRRYTTTRIADGRIAARIRRALRGAGSVLNVGAGAGAYEPHELSVIAVEPSAEMVRQRPAGAAPVVQATAEALPFRDASFDASLSVLSVHHWADHDRGLRELRRVVRRRVVIFTWDPALADHPSGYPFWLREYVPEISTLRRFPTLQELRAGLGEVSVEEVPIPADCRDGFGGAFWARPECYLDPQVRAGMSGFHFLDPASVERSMQVLAADLARGRWDERFGHLRTEKEADLGYRLVIATVNTKRGRR